MKRTLIWIGALVVGAVLGLLGINWLNEVMNVVATIYTRLFQLLAVPTIVLAVITTFATFGSKGSGRIFVRTITYTLLTTFAAAIVGALLYLIIAPSNLPSLPELTGEASASIPQQGEAAGFSYLSHLISIIPNNILRPILEGNVLSLLLLAFVVGIGLSKLPDSENKSVVVKGLLGLQELLFLLIRWLIWTLPLGIVAFSAQLLAQVSAGVISDSIGKYVLVILGGNFLQFFVVLPLFLLAKGLNPIHVLGRMMPAVLMALFTKSSAATLPVTMESERRHPHHAGHHPPLDSHLRLLGRRQCRCAHGLLFPHPLIDVGHRCPHLHPRRHPPHLHHHRYGRNSRKRVVRLLRCRNGGPHDGGMLRDIKGV